MHARSAHTTTTPRTLQPHRAHYTAASKLSKQASKHEGAAAIRPRATTGGEQAANHSAIRLTSQQAQPASKQQASRQAKHGP
eukprot:6270710-Alexandrium_andersonii.AAC.1